MSRDVDKTATASWLTSGRDDSEPYVALKIESKGDLFGALTVRFTLEELDRLLDEAGQARDYVVEFEAQRGKQRAMAAR